MVISKLWTSQQACMIDPSLVSLLICHSLSFSHYIEELLLVRVLLLDPSRHVYLWHRHPVLKWISPSIPIMFSFLLVYDAGFLCVLRCCWYTLEVLISEKIASKIPDTRWCDRLELSRVRFLLVDVSKQSFILLLIWSSTWYILAWESCHSISL